MTTLTTQATKTTALTTAEADANFKKIAQTKGTNYVCAESDNRDTIEASAAITFTLPDASTITGLTDTGDYEVTLKNVSSGDVTITCLTGTDTIDGSTDDITIGAGDVETLKVNQAATGYNRLKGNILTGTTLSSPDMTSPTVTSGDINVSAGSVILDTTLATRRFRFESATNIMHIAGQTGGDVILYDETNTRDVWKYTEATNTFTVTATLTATSAALTTPTLTTPTITTPAITGGTVNGTTTSNFVPLATPQVLVSSATINADTLIDMSSVYAQAATDGAVMAQCTGYITITNNSAATAESELLCHSTAPGAPANQYRKVVCREEMTATPTADALSSFNVVLNGSSDFYWRHRTIAGTTSPNCIIYLTGYWV